MAIPEGYEKLAVIGIAWKGEYAAETAYKTLNAVHYQGSTYVALRDSPAGPPAADGANWMYLAKGFVAAMLSEITAVDASGALGPVGGAVGAQALIDAIADRVMTKLLARSQVVNNLLTTEEGYALDARQGKALKASIDSVNRDFKTVSIGGQLSYNQECINIDSAIQTGNLAHISGLLKAKVRAGISLSPSLAPKESFLAPCLNYDALNTKDYQCQVLAAVSSAGIMIDASEAPYTFTRFNILFCI